MKQLTALLLSLTLILGLTGCGAPSGGHPEQSSSSPAPAASSQSLAQPDALEPAEADLSNPEQAALPELEGYYYDLEQVVLYLDAYDALPSNFITKAEARELGWEGGSVERYLEGAAIGGDSFGNREGLLPRESGRIYTECDLNTNGQDSRGAERLVFSNDGLYFHTEDHYQTFTQVWVENGAVIQG